MSHPRPWRLPPSTLHLIQSPQDSSDEARLLWLRLPVSHRSHPDLRSLWHLARSILSLDYPNIYTPSPSNLESLVLSAFRNRTFHMISVVYKTISVTEFQTLSGVKVRADVDHALEGLGWRVEGEFVIPKMTDKCQSKTTISLTELANYISFLENV